MSDLDLLMNWLNAASGLRCLPTWIRNSLQPILSELGPTDLARYKRQLRFIENHIEPLAEPSGVRTKPEFATLCSRLINASAGSDNRCTGPCRGCQLEACISPQLCSQFDHRAAFGIAMPRCLSGHTPCLFREGSTLRSTGAEHTCPSVSSPAAASSNC